MSNEAQDSADFSPRRMTFTCSLIALSTFPLFILEDQVGRGIAFMMLVAMTVLIVMLNWEHRKQRWFYITVLLLFCAQIPVVFLVKWPDISGPGVVFLAPVMVYFLLYIGLVSAAKKIFAR